MNSNSKKFDDDCCEPKCRKKEEQEFILLKVGNPTNTVIPSTAVNGNTFTVASLTTKTCNLDDPEIKIDFTSNIVVGAVVPGTGANLTFQVNKLFMNPFSPLSETIGPAWIFATPLTGVAETFTFFEEDDDDFDDGIVKYTVTATVGLGTTGTLGGPFTINNATLAVEIAAEEEK